MIKGKEGVISFICNFFLIWVVDTDVCHIFLHTFFFKKIQYLIMRHVTCQSWSIFHFSDAVLVRIQWQRHNPL